MWCVKRETDRQDSVLLLLSVCVCVCERERDVLLIIDFDFTQQNSMSFWLVLLFSEKELAV